tara:strand:+ start:1778 stop:3028 length:1251 start_codon:yes stop_codon:yes gene_type:complete
MSTPNGGLLTETNAQYYAGTQVIISKDITVNEVVISQTVFTATFDTDLTFGNSDPSQPLYNKNNFRLYTSITGGSGTFTEFTGDYTVVNNVITFTTARANNEYIVIQLLTESGGNFGNKNAIGDVVEKNYGGYAYISVENLINNFQVAYVGEGKLISSVKKTDIIFHTKRALQEFSYDTLKSIYSQELTIPSSLSVALPQDYVNYVNVSWIDEVGIKHIIYPTTLTSNPYRKPVQDANGVPTQDDDGVNITGTSITEERWVEQNTATLQALRDDITGRLIADGLWGVYGNGLMGYGQRYGMQPELAQINGWFTINDREGKMSFSSDLKDKIIILEYISDGLSYDQEMQVPKLAEEAVYSYVMHAIIASRINQPEYIVQRLRREKSAKLRNAKIRLSNIKSNEFIQIMRGKSKWIKN